jgi:hypothetical protein
MTPEARRSAYEPKRTVIPAPCLKTRPALLRRSSKRVSFSDAARYLFAGDGGERENHNTGGSSLAFRCVTAHAYNKQSVSDVELRFPPQVWASTLHTCGRRLLCQARNVQLNVDENKSLRLAELVYEGE